MVCRREAMKALTEHITVGYRDLLTTAIDSNAFLSPAGLVDSAFETAIEFPSGRSAIVAALTDAGFDKEDRVILPGYTCHALVAAVQEVATPMFIDISLDEFTMDLTKLEDAAKDASGVVPVHLYGNPMDMETVQDIADEHDLVIIEDAAQALGAATVDSTVGQASDYCVFSFRFSKEVTTHVGGLLLGDTLQFKKTSSPDRFAPVKFAMVKTTNTILETLPGPIYESLRRTVMDPLFRSTAETINETDPRPFSTYQRRLLSIQLDGLSERVQTRRKHAHTYSQGLSGPICTPSESPDHTYFRYPVLVPGDARDDICRELRRKGVGVSTMYSYSVSPPGTCENAEEAARRMVIPPVHAALSERMVKRIMTAFNEVVERHA